MFARSRICSVLLLLPAIPATLLAREYVRYHYYYYKLYRRLRSLENMFDIIIITSCTSDFTRSSICSVLLPAVPATSFAYYRYRKNKVKVRNIAVETLCLEINVTVLARRYVAPSKVSWPEVNVALAERCVARGSSLFEIRNLHMRVVTVPSLRRFAGHDFKNTFWKPSFQFLHVFGGAIPMFLFFILQV